MSSVGSVTCWIRQLEAGDQAAFQKLWEGYFHRLVGLARKRLQGAPYAVLDVRTPPSSRLPGKVATAGFFDEEWRLAEKVK